jgi:hypothetical protein
MSIRGLQPDGLRSQDPGPRRYEERRKSSCWTELRAALGRLVMAGLQNHCMIGRQLLEAAHER